jgi:hypothetical protein
MIQNKKTRKLQRAKFLMNNSFAMDVIKHFKAKKDLNFIKLDTVSLIFNKKKILMTKKMMTIKLKKVI